MEPIAGGNSPYDYIGERGSATCLHKDDADLQSCNMVISGWKLWIVLAKRHTEKFEAFIRQNWEANRCAQFVRHLSLFIGPKKLRQESIDFAVHCAGRGDMVIIEPGQYHAVVNYSACFATAINFTLPGKPVMPEAMAVCEHCGLCNLQQPDLRRVSPPETAAEPAPATARVAGRKCLTKRQAPAAQTTQPAKKPKAIQMQPELAQVIKQVRKVDRLCKIPQIDETDPPTPEVLKLALAIGIRAAIQQFCDLVRSRRDPNNERARLHLSKDLHTRIGQRLGHLGTSQRRSNFERLMVRLDQHCLACDIDQSKQGRIRADTAFLNSLAKEINCPRETITRHQKQGNKWRRLCGNRKELLCFVFLTSQNPFNISVDAFLSLSENDLGMLHILDNNYIDELCSAARALLDSMDSVSPDVEFGWEVANKASNDLPENEMLSLLRPTPQASENVYDPGKYPDWPPPPGWPEDSPWPTDPTKILGADERKCDFCEAGRCECVTQVPSRNRSTGMPRIKDYKDLGRGLQAVGSRDGQAAYRAGEIIGFLIGDIVPSGTFQDSQTLDFARPDFCEEPVVCQIRCVEISNSFRLINHSCRPSARLVQVRASGRYVTAIKATSNIPDGAQITVSYGRDWKANPCLCESCQE
ncbi:lysine -specific demethylase 4c-like protein [Colletotrichum sojae]|uniref:Lysine -specific demethylase 4c-like protein n=1 Tax=Colletotrichum sojae TaxID=2175907 RepID=A0A8H6MIW3_9PEZI|nr:lysine -specific demethylase 4c-like protein [Colletotrichum sojae]